MSSALAIASVTAVLKGMLDNALSQTPWASAVGNPSVSALPLDRVVPSGSADPNQLNLFLYQVTPNLGWRNVSLASRDSTGQPTSNPPLALDLHYLLTAYGEDNFHAEVLLGHAMQVFHETPGLGRNAIRAALGGSGGVTNISAALLKALATSELADQFEQIKITPQFLTTEELSKLWTASTARFRPTMAYLVTVVLIESQKTVRTPLPVLQRGLGDFGVSVQPSLLAPVPTLVAVRPPNRQPAVRAGLTFDKLRLFGHHLGTGEVTVIFTHSRLDLEITLNSAGGSPGVTRLTLEATTAEKTKDPSLQLADAGLEVDPAKAAGQWAAGIYTLAARLGSTTANDAPTTNSLPAAVAPEFATTGPNAPEFATDTDGNPIIRLTCGPSFNRAMPQRMSLIVGEQELAGAPEFPVTIPPTNVTSNAVFKNTLAGTSGTSPLARLRVDGVESLSILQPDNAPPQFDDTQRLHFPP